MQAQLEQKAPGTIVEDHATWAGRLAGAEQLFHRQAERLGERESDPQRRVGVP